jgi:hypothetical protein
VFARVATFEGLDVARAEQTMKENEARAVEILEGLDGWTGGMTLVDRQSGKVLAVNLFESEEALQAAEPTFEEMPRRAGPDVQQNIASRRTSVERFEVVSERRKG